MYRCTLAKKISDKIIKPLQAVLTQGVTPQKIAASLSSGLVIATIPVIGVTTLLCGVFAAIFKLNQVAIQTMNWLAYPIQIALIYPYLKAGEKVFGTTENIVMKAVYGIAVWAVTAPLVGYLLYFVFLFLVKKLPSKEPAK